MTALARSLTLVLFLPLLLNAAVFADELVLVQDGEPRAVLVVEANQPKADRAAALLQSHIHDMSGATLPILADGDTAPADVAVILVGQTKAVRELNVDVPSGYDPTVRADAFEEEGYVLKRVGRHLIVAGNNDGPYLGTVYAACALLEHWGCRWYFPGEWGRVVPEKRKLTVGDLDVLSRPDFAVRRISLISWLPVSKEEREQYNQWSERIGFNMGDFYPLVGDGFLGYLVPQDRFYPEHPEYYAMDKAGNRVVGSNPNWTMLCLSNPDVFEQSVKTLTAAFEGREKSRIVAHNGFGISPPDGQPRCLCPACLKASQNFHYPQYFAEPMTSEEVFGFAAKLAERFPDKYVSTMAYALREMPPQGVNILDNMMVMYAPISNDVLHASDAGLWRRTEFIRILRQWRERTPHVTIYDYTPNLLTGMFVPERDVANMAVEVPKYKQIGIKGMMRQGSKMFMASWISYYVTAKLLWDAEADVEAIKRDFYNTFFGEEAGPYVQAWFDACEARLASTPPQAHEDFLISHLYDTAFVRSIEPHVDGARAAKKTPAQQQRFEAFELIAAHLSAWAAMTQAERELDYKAAAAAAERMTQAKRRLQETYSFFIHVYDKKPRWYYADARKLKFEEWAAKMDGTTGELVAVLPERAKFRRDPFNEGVIAQWYLPDVDDASWEERDTYLLWDQQEPFLNEAGRDYDGHGWYRATFDMPERFAGRRVVFRCGGVINEGWVWINGKYAGHQPHKAWWGAGHDFELDVSAMVKPGRNTIAIRVYNSAEHGGLYRRGFFYSPRPESP